MATKPRPKPEAREWVAEPIEKRPFDEAVLRREAGKSQFAPDDDPNKWLGPARGTD